MMKAKLIDTPIGTSSKLDADELDLKVNETMYCGITGSLLYLTARRTDIVFSVAICARF